MFDVHVLTMEFDVRRLSRIIQRLRLFTLHIPGCIHIHMAAEIFLGMCSPTAVFTDILWVFDHLIYLLKLALFCQFTNMP